MPRAQVVSAAVTVIALSLAVPATAPAAYDHEKSWTRAVQVDAGADKLGLRKRASDRALARAAIGRNAKRLGLRAGDRLELALQTKLAGAPKGVVPVRMLRFRQTVGGLRVLWSELDVDVRGGRVGSVSGATVPLKRNTLAGRIRISGARARAIARRAFAGGDSALPAQLVAYAGSPGQPRRARRAYVVEVTPAGQAGDDERSLCIIVDAESGKVLERWWGTAARPASDGDRASAASAPKATKAATTVLYQLANYARQPGENNYAYGKTRLTVHTTGDPFWWGNDGGLGGTFFDVFDPNLSLLGPWLTDVTRFFCWYRQYCGRDSGTVEFGGGDVNRWFFVGNYFKSAYNGADDHIFIDADDSNNPGVVAHEIGHSIDRHYRNDYEGFYEAYMVDEGLANMFAYDFDQDRDLADGSKSSLARVPWTFDRDSEPAKDPDGTPLNYAGHMPGKSHPYNCKARDEHTNSTILTHAYYQLVQELGYDQAGYILRNVPWQLPPQRYFAETRKAFWRAASSSQRPAVERAFNHVGLYDNTKVPPAC